MININGHTTNKPKVQPEDLTLYSACLTLKRPGYALKSDRHFNLLEKDGASHFRIEGSQVNSAPERRFALVLNMDENPLFGTTDRNGMLVALSYGPFSETSMDDAESLAHFKLCKAMSILSLRFNSPLESRLLRIEHLFSGRVRYVHPVPDWEVSLPVYIGVDSPLLLQRCASFYRDGLISSSPLYSFLCFYKVICTIRHARNKDFPGRRFDKERLPSNPAEALEWMKDLFFGVQVDWNTNFLANLLPAKVEWGMSFGDIIDRVLRVKRNEIAHAFEDPSAQAVDPDNPITTHEVRLMLPLVTLIARVMIRNTYPSILSVAKICEQSS